MFRRLTLVLRPDDLDLRELRRPRRPRRRRRLRRDLCFLRLFEGPFGQTAGTAGLLLGAALLTKFTCLALYFIWPALWILNRVLNRDRRFQSKYLLIMIFSSLLVVNIGYGFRDVFRPLGDFKFVSRILAGTTVNNASTFENGSVGQSVSRNLAQRVACSAPCRLLAGDRSSKTRFRSALLLLSQRHLRERGWWYYYFYAISIKEPIGFLTLAIGAIVFTTTRLRSRSAWFDALCVWLPAVFFLVFVSSQTGFSHHMRYVLPAWPFMIVSTSKLAALFDRGRKLAAAMILGLFAWGAASVLLAYPHMMSYFNEFAGGPEHGAEHLLDSNMDWGQDLLDLKSWLDAHPEASPLGLLYFNAVEPSCARHRISPAAPRSERLVSRRSRISSPFRPASRHLRGQRRLSSRNELLRTRRSRRPSRCLRDDYSYFRRFRPMRGRVIRS